MVCVLVCVRVVLCGVVLCVLRGVCWLLCVCHRCLRRDVWCLGLLLVGVCCLFVVVCVVCLLFVVWRLVCDACECVLLVRDCVLCLCVCLFDVGCCVYCMCVDG